MGLLGSSSVLLPDLSFSKITSYVLVSCLCTLVRAVLSKMVAASGYQALELCLVQIEVFCKCEKQARFQRLSTKKDYKLSRQ